MKKIYTTIILLAIYSLSTNAQNVNIPDVAFKAALVGDFSINTNMDTEIQVTEAAAFTGTIDVTGLGITDLTGIEAFTSLDVLYCDNNNLTSLNLSANTALEFLNCSNNQLTSLDVTANTALTDFYCGINQLTSLNVTANTLLQVLDCSVNPFTSLNVTANTALSDLYCNNNQLTSLDVTANAVLGNLECNGNQLTSLDVSVDTALSILDCSGNQLTSLNVKNNNNINFEDFYANNNPNLNCIQVDDSAWSTTNWTNIDSVASFSTNCSSTVSVNDMINHTNTVSIYPNPGNGVFTISQSNTNKTEIEIYNILGELIYQSTINNHQLKLI